LGDSGVGLFFTDKFGHQFDEFDYGWSLADAFTLGGFGDGGECVHKFDGLFSFAFFRATEQRKGQKGAEVEKHGPEQRVGPDVEAGESEELQRPQTFKAE
jgi:hypothetical protein